MALVGPVAIASIILSIPRLVRTNIAELHLYLLSKLIPCSCRWLSLPLWYFFSLLYWLLAKYFYADNKQNWQYFPYPLLVLMLLVYYVFLICSNYIQISLSFTWASSCWPANIFFVVFRQLSIGALPHLPSLRLSKRKCIYLSCSSR